MALYAPCLRADPLPAVAAQVPSFFSLQAGTTTRSAVDAFLGPPSRSIGAHVHQYRPAPGAHDIAYLIVEYFPDSPQLARLDAYLLKPLPTETLRAQFGKPALVRERSDGKQEQLFFPRLNGVVHASGKPDEVVAISYLSPRALADAFIDQFNQHIKAKRYAEALEPAGNAVTADPDYARGYLSQGIAYYYQKNFDEALVRFVAAARAPYTTLKQAHARTWLGILYWQHKKQPDKAREEFDKALALAPDFDIVRLNFGRYLRAQDQSDQAIAQFNKAIELKQSAAIEARSELASLYYGRKDWKNAVTHYSLLADWADSTAAAEADAILKSTAYANYAHSLMATNARSQDLSGRDEVSEKVISLYEKALRLDAGNTFIYNNLGYEYEQAQDFRRAEALFRKGLAIDADHFQLNGNLSDALLEQRRYDEARRQAEHALSLKRDSTWMMMNVARAHAAMDRKEDALAWLRKAGAAGYQARQTGLYLEDGHFEGIVSDDELRRLLPGRR